MVQISIHALARRATYNLPTQGADIDISIHALARRATFQVYLPSPGPAHFNPRSRKESDSFCVTGILPPFGFQSTLSQGERPYWRVYNDWFRDISIHALARRATSRIRVFRMRIFHFNPRSRKESDQYHAVASANTVAISIHALARRATMILWS